MVFKETMITETPVIINDISFKSPEVALNYLHGRLSGLSGTTRFRIPEELTTELIEMKNFLAEVLEQY